MDEIRSIGDGELDRWVAIMRAVDEDTGTVEDYVDWRRQAHETVWLLASDGNRDVGAGIGVGGWHEPPGVARGSVRVVGSERARGVGTALLEHLVGSVPDDEADSAEDGGETAPDDSSDGDEE